MTFEHYTDSGSKPTRRCQWFGHRWKTPRTLRSVDGYTVSCARCGWIEFWRRKEDTQ